MRNATAEDVRFLRTLFATTRQFELSALPSAMQESFLRMQFDAQRAHYRSAFPKAEHSIILASELPAGRICLDRHESAIHIVDFALLPEYQQRGIGRTVISGLQSEAAAAGKTLTGHVATANPAQEFWQRMGFQITPHDEMYWRITWHPLSSP